MAEKKTAVFGIYTTVGQAERAVDALVLARLLELGCVGAAARQSELRRTSRTRSTPRRRKAPRPASRPAARSAARSACWPASARWPFPGVGPFIAAGPIMGALAGLGVGGAVGGLVGALVGMGIPEYEAKRYEGRVKDGGVLLSVHCDTSDEITRAKDVLKATGAEDISSAGEEAVAAARKA